MDVSVIFFFLGYFLPFYIPNSPKNQNFLKKKKISGYIIILTYVYQNLWLDDNRW